ncbi:MAG: YceI family protein [Saprospiraceae bacterium]|nr:YceI family protein [Saprospiraceae bacterium]
MKKFLIGLVCLCCLNTLVVGQIYSTNTGTLRFVSEAPLELIKAESKELQGALNIEKKTFAFKLMIKSFKGFNSPLQQEHFYENYLEAQSYPQAVFTGKVLETIKEGKGNYRAKGDLTIHGVTKEVIIEVNLIVEAKTVDFKADFAVALQDYHIELPRIVYQKIAEVIEVTVEGQLQLRP